MGMIAATTLGRVWLMATAVLLVGLAERQAGLAAAVLVLVLFTISFVGRGSRTCSSLKGEGGVKTKTKVLIGLGVYLAIAILMLLIFGNAGKNDDFKPQNEFKLEPWISIKIGGLDLSINKAVLYLVLAQPHDRDDGLHRQPHAGAAEPRADRGRGHLRADARQHHRRQHGPQDGGQVVPVHRDALPLHLVLEHDRLPAAADQHRAQGRHLRPARSRRSRCTRRPRTSRSRWR